MGIDTIFRQNMKMAMKWKSSVYNLPYMMGIDAIFRQNMKMALKSTWLKIGIGPRELAVKNGSFGMNYWRGSAIDRSIKAKLQKEGIFFLIHLFARDILILKKLEIEETKNTYYSTFKTDIIKVGLVFFIKKSSLANKWMSFSYSNSALSYTTFLIWPLSRG